MPLRVLRSTDERLAGPEVAGALHEALVVRGEALLLVPSLAQALVAQRELASMEGLAMGVACTTPAEWVALRWALYGDGRTPVDAPMRSVLMARCLARAGSEPMGAGAGTAEMLGKVAQRGLAWLPAEGDEPVLSGGERVALEVLRRYRAELAERGLVEPCQMAAELPARLAHAGMRVPTVVFAGFDAEPPRMAAELAHGLSGLADVLMVERRPSYEMPCTGRASELGELLRAVFAEGDDGKDGNLGDALCDNSGGGEADGGDVASDFHAGAHSACEAATSGVARPITQTGAVRLLEPAGPVAEAELVCREVERLAAAGAREVVVCSADVAHLWGRLAPKLQARGISACAQLSVPVAQTRAGSAYLRLAREVARLVELAGSWPGPRDTAEGPVPQLGDMSWWPPVDVVDYLLADVSGAEPERAWMRDASWRGNRILTPAAVLALLKNPKETSPATARAVAHLMRGHFKAAAGELTRALEERARQTAAVADDGVLARGVAAEFGAGVAPACGNVASVSSAVQSAGCTAGANAGHKLDAPAASDAMPFRPGAAEELSRLEAEGALSAVASAADALRRLGLASERPQGKGTPKVELLTLCELEALLEQALAGASVVLRPRLEVPDAACEVRIVAPAQAAELPCLGADALIYLGLDSGASSVGNNDDALTALMGALGIELPADLLARARRQMAAIVRVPRLALSLGRCAHTADAEPTYPAVLLGEVVDAYGYSEPDARGRRRPLLVAGGEQRLDEAPASANLAPAVPACAVHELPGPAPAGALDPSLRRFVTPPRDGTDELPGGMPSLSASQIESYLECPYKWFSLRRLGLDTTDAGFGPMEMGTFAHRVFELTHRELLRRALVAQGHELPSALAEQPWDGTLPAGVRPQDRIPGSAVRPENLDEAIALMNEVFDAHLAHQYLEGRRRASQALIPHSESERLRLEGLRADIAQALRFESVRLEGFEPRFFELRFGGAAAARVSYGGADLQGTIDRVDIDGHGRAIVIDYKHKARISGEYALWPSAEPERFELPRHVQTLMYASVLPQLVDAEGLRVVGAVYFGTRGEPVFSGAIEEGAAERLYPPSVTGKLPPSASRYMLPAAGVRGMDELCQLTEERIATAVQDMLAGRIDAAPKDAHACEWCPVTSCERRLK